MRDYVASTWYTTPIHKACYENDVAGLRALVESLSQSEAAESQIALRDHHGWTALHVAVFMNSIETTEILLSIRSVDIFTVTGGGALGHTALHLACSRGHCEIVRMLLIASLGRFDDKMTRTSTMEECLSWAGKRSRF